MRTVKLCKCKGGFMSHVTDQGINAARKRYDLIRYMQSKELRICRKNKTSCEHLMWMIYTVIRARWSDNYIILLGSLVSIIGFMLPCIALSWSSEILQRRPGVLQKMLNCNLCLRNLMLTAFQLVWFQNLLVLKLTLCISNRPNVPPTIMEPNGAVSSIWNKLAVVY